MAFPVPPLLAQATPYVSTETSVFDQLVLAGEKEAQLPLPPQMHGFLVECLAEHLSDMRVMRRTLTFYHLRAMKASPHRSIALFKLAGDEALLVAGLFPGVAKKRNVPLRYFRHMGQAAYASVAARLMGIGRPDHGRFFDDVAGYFIPLMTVLQGARQRPEACWNLKKMLEVRRQEMAH